MTQEIALPVPRRSRSRLGRAADRFRWLADHSFGIVLALVGFTPNGATLFGAAVCVGSSVAWTQHLHHPELFWWCLAAFVVGAAFDWWDGSVARLRPERKRPSGPEVDSNTDRVVEMFLYAAVGEVLAAQGHPVYAFVAFAAGIGSFMISHLRARSDIHDIDGEVGWAPREVRLPLVGVLIIVGHHYGGYGWGMVAMATYVWPMAAWRFIHLTRELNRREE